MPEKKDNKERERLRKKSEVKKSVSAAAAAAHAVAKIPLDFEAGYATGYETDAGPSTGQSKKKAKSKKKPKSAGAGDAGYETDDGYMSVGGKPKSKPKFFKLGSKSKVPTEEAISKEAKDIPASTANTTPQFRLPIAERFATTFGPNFNAAATIEPLLVPPVLPPASTVNRSPASAPTSERESLDMPPQRSSSKQSAVRFMNGSDSYSSSANDSIFSKAPSDSSSPTSPSSHGHGPLSLPNRYFPSSPPLTKSTEKLGNTGSPSKGQKHVPDALNLSPDTLAVSSVPPAAESPFVVITPVDPNAPIPSESMSTKDASAKSKGRFFGDLMPRKSVKKAPQGLVISSPIPVDTPSSFLSPGTSITAASSDSFSSRLHELPPPSPPPGGPLPALPQPGQSEYVSKFTGQQQQFSNPTSPAGSRAVSPNPWVNNTVRGREAPFPARPVLPQGEVPGAIRSGPGLESRMKVRRYRELYGMDVGDDPSERFPPQRDYSVDPVPLAAVSHSGNMIISGSRRYEGDEYVTHPKRRGVAFRATLEVGYAAGDGLDLDGRHDDQEYENEDPDEEIHLVANQFKRTSSDLGHSRQAEPAIGRAQSFEKLKAKFEAASGGQVNEGYHRRGTSRPNQPTGSPYDPPSIYIEDEAYAGMDDDASGYAEGGDRSTVYSIGDSASVYTMNSRVSMMDAEKSEEARERFLRRIDAMFDKNGRELPPRDYVPPVPSLPAALQVANADRSGWL